MAKGAACSERERASWQKQVRVSKSSKLVDHRGWIPHEKRARASPARRTHRAEGISSRSLQVRVPLARLKRHSGGVMTDQGIVALIACIVRRVQAVTLPDTCVQEIQGADIRNSPVVHSSSKRYNADGLPGHGRRLPCTVVHFYHRLTPARSGRSRLLPPPRNYVEMYWAASAFDRSRASRRQLCLP